MQLYSPAGHRDQCAAKPGILQSALPPFAISVHSDPINPALTSLALGIGEGAVVQASLARAVVGGLTARR